MSENENSNTFYVMLVPLFAIAFYAIFVLLFLSGCAVGGEPFVHVDAGDAGDSGTE